MNFGTGHLRWTKRIDSSLNLVLDIYLLSFNYAQGRVSDLDVEKLVRNKVENVCAET